MQMSKGVYPVIDLSEGGLSFSTDVGQFLTGEVYNLKLHFKDGEQFSSSAEVVRLSAKSVSLRLSTEVPYRKIVAEQLRLKNSYPNI